MSNIQIPIDVLTYWYEAAKEGVSRYEQCAYHPQNTEMESKRKRAYEMAKKTIKCLENVVETVEIIESEETNNE